MVACLPVRPRLVSLLYVSACLLGCAGCSDDAPPITQGQPPEDAGQEPGPAGGSAAQSTAGRRAVSTSAGAGTCSSAGRDAAAPIVRDAAVTDAGPLPTSGCFAPGERPESVEPAGFAMPDLAAERDAYDRFGWRWDDAIEPE